MGLMRFLKGSTGGVPAISQEVEKRSSFEATQVSVSDSSGIMRLFDLESDTIGADVTIDTALTVPAVWAAVKFISSTMAVLPKHVYRKDKDGNKTRVHDHPIARLLSGAPNDETSNYDWFFNGQKDACTAGRMVAFIERNQRSDVINLWPLDTANLTLKREQGRTRYFYKDGRRYVTYQADEVIDIRNMPGSNRLQAVSPIMAHRKTIGLALAVAKYGAKIFGNGGIPPFVVTGPFTAPGAMERASADVERTMEKANAEGKMSVSIPDGHSVNSVGLDPEKMQMIEAQRFVIEQIARIFGLPPVFLQDLTHGTFSNTEMQDGNVAKHAINHLASQWEQELKLKLFGRDEAEYSVSIVLDGLLRGDFKTRMDGLARGVQSGQLTPNEARALDNRPPLPGGDVLYVQGAMVPLAETKPGDGSDGQDN